MSSFSGLSTALSSVMAQRRALEVAGQNIANANTPGYTRQRLDLASVEGVSVPSMSSVQNAAGNGVRVAGLTRMGDSFLDARVNAETSGSSFAAGRAAVLDRLEVSLGEPGEHGLASKLESFWGGWQDVANNPSAESARKVLLGDAAALVEHVAGGYRSVQTQWTQMRTEADALTTEVNSTATAVADLNSRIRSIQVAGGAANELVDQRDALVTTLSGLVGASARPRADGTLDVMVAGNALVRGDRANAITASGSWTMAGGIGVPPAAVDPVRLSWSGTGQPLTLTGGRLASHVSALAPAADGGLLARAAASYDAVATTLRDTVNAVHSTGQTRLPPPQDTGMDFFASAPGVPAALGLSVAVKDPAGIAAADPARGPLDGSMADRISQLATAPDGADALWRGVVVDLGVQSRAATQRADNSEAARGAAENLQRSQASVDLDEESVNMLTYQRAYEGAARVMTAIDEMLDVLINRTGVVGR